jgi:hypothetical protein
VTENHDLPGGPEEDDVDFFLRQASEAEGLAEGEADLDTKADWHRAAFSWRLLAENTLARRTRNRTGAVDLVGGGERKPL